MSKVKYLNKFINYNKYKLKNDQSKYISKLESKIEKIILANERLVYLLWSMNRKIQEQSGPDYATYEFLKEDVSKNLKWVLNTDTAKRILKDNK